MGKPTDKPSVDDLFDGLVKQLLEDKEADGFQVLAVMAVLELSAMRKAVVEQTAAVLVLTKVFEDQVNDLIVALEELRGDAPEPGPEAESG